MYCPRAFNEYGDIVAHLDLASRDVSRMDFLRSATREVDGDAIDVLNAFVAGFDEIGARAFMLFPCIHSRTTSENTISSRRCMRGYVRISTSRC